MTVPLIDPDKKQQQIERQKQKVKQILFDTSKDIYTAIIAAHGVDPLKPSTILQMCKTAEYSKVAASILLKEFGLIREERNEEVS